MKRPKKLVRGARSGVKSSGRPKSKSSFKFNSKSGHKSKVRQLALPAPDESQEIVLAIRRGTIDALVIAGEDGEQILTLPGAEHPYRVLVETITDGVATLDEAGMVLYANSRIAAILRAPNAQFIGSLFESYVHSSERGELKRLITEGLKNSAQGEITLHADEGRPRLIRLALSPVRNSHPRTVCVVATELTELAEANEALRNNEESLQQLSARLLKLQDEERRHIARDLHDVTGQKLAVQSISLAQVLSSKVVAADPETTRILNECAILTKQVGEEIRTLSYLLHPPLLDELGLASAVGWYAEGFGRRTGIELELDIASDIVRLPPDVEVALFRVIQESLTNVHRYSGTARAHVKVRVTSSDIEVQIADFGKGIHQSMLSSSNGNVAPLGVGIQGMNERIRQLGGKLEITSKPNKGTKVTATIPLAPLHANRQTVPDSSPSLSAAAPVKEDAHRGANSRKQILIVDDHEMLRQGIRTMIEKEPDLDVCGEAADGREAVNMAMALHPDLIILDINLPVLNGLAAVSQILRHSPKTKILIFTVHDSEQTWKEIRAAGAHGYLSKGKGVDDLLRTVRGLLELAPMAASAPA